MSDKIRDKQIQDIFAREDKLRKQIEQIRDEQKLMFEALKIYGYQNHELKMELELIRKELNLHYKSRYAHG